MHRTFAFLVHFVTQARRLGHMGARVGACPAAFVLTLAAMVIASVPDAGAQDDKTKVYLARMETSLGVIELELDREKAKETVDNFLAYARDGYYDGTLFHRVEKDYIVQGGGYQRNKDGECRPKGTGDRKPVKSQAGNGLKNGKGTIAAARHAGDKDSAKSEFYFNLADNGQLDEPFPAGSGFTVFGKIVSGMEVLEKIAAAELQKEGVLRLPRKDGDKTVYDDYKVGFLPKEDIVLRKVSVEAKKEG